MSRIRPHCHLESTRKQFLSLPNSPRKSLPTTAPLPTYLHKMEIFNLPNTGWRKNCRRLWKEANNLSLNDWLAIFLLFYFLWFLISRRTIVQMRGFEDRKRRRGHYFATQALVGGIWVKTLLAHSPQLHDIWSDACCRLQRTLSLYSQQVLDKQKRQSNGIKFFPPHSSYNSQCSIINLK